MNPVNLRFSHNTIDADWKPVLLEQVPGTFAVVDGRGILTATQHRYPFGPILSMPEWPLETDPSWLVMMTGQELQISKGFYFETEIQGLANPDGSDPVDKREVEVVRYTWSPLIHGEYGSRTFDLYSPDARVDRLPNDPPYVHHARVAMDSTYDRLRVQVWAHGPRFRYCVTALDTGQVSMDYTLRHKYWGVHEKVMDMVVVGWVMMLQPTCSPKTPARLAIDAYILKPFSRWDRLMFWVYAQLFGDKPTGSA